MNDLGGMGLKAQRFVPDLREVDFLRLLLILAAAWLLILLVQRLLPWLEDRTPGGVRFYILPLVPLLRLLILFVAFVEIVPIVIRPTPQNLFAVLVIVVVSFGFAFKGSIGSLLAGLVANYEKPYRPDERVRIEDTYGEVRALCQRLRDVAVTSPYLLHEGLIAVVVSEQPWGTHYPPKAYPIDSRDQFQFTSDLSIRGKAALAALGVAPTLPGPASKGA